VDISRREKNEPRREDSGHAIFEENVTDDNVNLSFTDPVFKPM
jgi:hypothetical protein